MGTPVVEIRLLGPVEVEVDGERADLRARLPRSLVVALALRPGRVVGVDALVSALWGDDPPGSALGTLQSYVSTVRRSLGDRGRTAPLLDRRGDGYLLDIAPESVDTVRFERLVADARAAASPAEAETLLDRALALWRGPALADVAAEGFARGPATRLDELRLSAQEARIAAGLALGRHQALVPEVEALVAEHPLREGLTAQLMVALYRSGRQADALRAYERTRSALIDELGISPSADLADLEGRVLRQDVEGSPHAPPIVAPPAGSMDPTVAGPSTSASDTTDPSQERRDPAEAAAGTDDDAATTGAPPDGASAPRRRRTDRAATALTPVVDLPLPLEAARGGRRLAPLVGRGTEMDRITSTWADPGARRVLAVSGDAGIGKSRLVAELATTVHGDGGLVLWGACAEQGGSAYRPFVEALRPLATTLAASGPITAAALGPGGPHLVRLVPELSPGADAGEPTSTGDERGPLFDTLTSVLRQATAGRPTLLVVDDLHWADASTCALLVHLARAPELDNVILAVTYRSAETTHPEPAARMLAELRRLRVVEQVPLAGLDVPATAELVAALSAGDEDGLDPDRAAELHDRTDGNPFFVEELVAHAREAGGEGLPVAVVDIVERRLADLDPEHRRVLAAAAVLGRAFDTELLAATAGVAEADLLDPLDEAIHHQLVTEAAPPVGRFEFAHALIRDGLLDGMTALRRSRLHLAAADAIDALGAPPELFSQRSHHLVAAGPAVPPERVIAALHATADQALKVAAYDEAEAACSLALERMDLAEGSAEAVDILLVLGLVRMAVGDLPGARKVFRWAADAARALGDGRRLGLAATGLGTGSGVGVAYELGVVDEERVAWLEEALTLIAEDDVHLRTRFLAHLGVALYDGDPVRRGEVTAEALALAAELGDPTYSSAAYIARRIDLWTPDADLDERLETSELAIRHADEGGDPLYTIVTRIAALADHLDAADLDRYDELHAEAEVLARPLRQKRWDWFLDVSRGCRALSRGEYEDAEAIIDSALETVGDAMGTVPVLTHAAARVVLDRDLGRHAAVIEMVTVLAADAVGPPPSVFVASTAVILAEMGDLEGAAALAGPYLAGDVEHMRPDYLWATTVGWFAEVAHRLDDAEAAARCSALLVGHEERLLALGGSAVGGGLGARPRGLAALTTGDVDDAVALLQQALDGHRRLGLRPWAVRSAIELSAALRRRGADGDEAAAADLDRVAAEEAAALGMPLPSAPTAPTR